MAESTSRATTPYRAIVELGSRLSRDTLLYTAGTSLALPIGLATTAFLTRSFQVAQYGELAVLFAFAGLMTIVLNLVYLQGPLLLVFLHVDAAASLDPDVVDAATRHERPVMLSTGLAMTSVLGALGVGLVALLAHPIASLLVGRSSAAPLVLLAAGSAVCGCLFRYATNVTRFEKRAGSFAVCSASRPLVALAATVGLVLAGWGLSAALIGTAIGSLVGAAGAVAVSRRSYALRVSLQCARRALRAGLPWVAVVVGLYFAHSADILLLRASASSAELGAYRIADSLALVISYGVSAFHLAQVPLDATLMSQAAYDEYSRDRVMATYVLAYMIAAVFITLLLTSVSGLVIGVLAPGYERSVPWVPLTAMAYVAYGFLLTVFRAGDFFKNRVRAYGFTAGSAGALVILFALAGGQLIGVAGVPIGATLGCLLPSAALLYLGHRAGHPLPLDYPRLGGALALGVVCLMPGVLAPGDQAAAIIARFAGLCLLPVALIAFGVIPSRSRRDLRAMVRALLPGGDDVTALVSALERLPPIQRAALEAMARDRLAAPAAATRLGVDQATLLRSVVAGLRALCGGSGDTALDDGIGHYLTSKDTPANLDSAMRELRRAGVDMVQFRVIERTYNQLERAPQRAWTRASPDRAHQPGLAGVALRALIASDWDLAGAARELGCSGSALSERALSELRQISGDGAVGPHDELLARFLFGPESAPAAGQLWAAGVDPLELHSLDLALASLRRSPPRSRPPTRQGHTAIARVALR